MIDEPSTIIEDSFQQAWTKVVKTLSKNDWERRNLVVQMKNPGAFDEGLHQNIEEFCRQVSILGPRHIAYTIFPQEFYTRNHSAEHLFNGYNRRNARGRGK
jgi:hypothetical protein